MKQVGSKEQEIFRSTCLDQARKEVILRYDYLKKLKDLTDIKVCQLVMKKKFYDDQKNNLFDQITYEQNKD